MESRPTRRPQHPIATRSELKRDEATLTSLGYRNPAGYRAQQEAKGA